MKRFFKSLLLFVAALAGLALLLAAGAYWWLFSTADVPRPELAGRMVEGSLVHQGHDRSWRAYIPSGETTGVPVLLVLHGSRGDGQRALESTYYEFNRLAESQRFIAVYPDGFEQHWNDCRGSASYSANTQGIDDVGFIRSLVVALAERHQADPESVFATGISNGGHMAYRLGLEAPDLVSGIAPIAAGMPVADNLDCDPSGEPVAVLIINGTEDSINPYQGGVVELLGDRSRGAVLSSVDSAAYWARLSGFDGPGESQSWPDRAPGDGTTVESLYWSAEGRSPVGLVTLVGGGHNVPHPRYRAPRIVGTTSHEFDAAALIWSFFRDGALSPPQG